jgi:hypothetical protein
LHPSVRAVKAATRSASVANRVSAFNCATSNCFSDNHSLSRSSRQGGPALFRSHVRRTSRTARAPWLSTTTALEAAGPKAI